MTIVKLLCFELDVILTEPRLNWTTNLDAGLVLGPTPRLTNSERIPV